MAYLPERNLLILEIPKAASRSLVYAATDKGQRILPAQGHMPIAELFHAAQPAPHPTVIGLIRDPAARFVSALNYRFTTTRKHQIDDLDVAMQYALNRPGDLVFTPQSAFLSNIPDTPHTLRLFPVERIADALALIGWTDTPPRQNSGTPKWTRAQIEAHPLYPRIMRGYEKDQMMRQDMQHGDGTANEIS